MKIYAKINDNGWQETGEPSGDWTYENITFNEPRDFHEELYSRGKRVAWWVKGEGNDVLVKACSISDRMKTDESRDLFDAREELIWAWLRSIVNEGETS
tara:strand:+ start:202 stop:498 length:297 start_codon:yes stop_codon:yes gene_type:complete